ncbi:hypothetical protein ADL29_16980 [Streptomyces chattanoogensis]|uniref:CdiI immunity protein domain-containing protein n=2 Tax=Streptomyces chattanoogensis TaxID=66876 RepID=A0A0N1JXV1_9ACTN|nr:hypothetical protein ADL29_16980 [Streptomyces chattanoogensis]
MRWTAWRIPGWKDDERLRDFYQWAFLPDLIDDMAGRKAYVNDGSEHAQRLRTSLEYLLEQQPADADTWYSITGYSFSSEGELYGYLLEVYDYFYGTRAEPPFAPAP